VTVQRAWTPGGLQAYSWLDAADAHEWVQCMILVTRYAATQLLTCHTSICEL
jgi:hypothetical protein